MFWVVSGEDDLVIFHLFICLCICLFILIFKYLKTIFFLSIYVFFPNSEWENVSFITTFKEIFYHFQNIFYEENMWG